jgi:hypothetical protein
LSGFTYAYLYLIISPPKSHTRMFWAGVGWLRCWWWWYWFWGVCGWVVF